MSVMTVILAEAYIGNEDYDDPDGPYWLEGEPVRIEVEAQDLGSGIDEQVRVGVMRDGNDQESAGIYLTLSGARDLIVGLGAAIREAETR